MALATSQGKQAAIEALAERRAIPPLPSDFNTQFPAGSPMFFNCDTCHEVIQVPEDYVPPRQRHCAECAALIALGWMQ